MLKERKKLSGIIFVFAAAIFVAGVMLCFWKGRKFETLQYTDHKGLETMELPLDEVVIQGAGTTYIEHEIVCSVEDEEKARQVAEAVNGELKSWQDGVAVIAIEETVNEFLKKYSNAPDLPTMYPNYIYHEER